MMRKPCPSSPVWPKFQREFLRKKREAACAKRVCGWLWVAAKWSQKQGFVDTAYLLMQQMTDYAEDS